MKIVKVDSWFDCPFNYTKESRFWVNQHCLIRHKMCDGEEQNFEGFPKHCPLTRTVQVIKNPELKVD